MWGPGFEIVSEYVRFLNGGVTLGGKKYHAPLAITGGDGRARVTLNKHPYAPLTAPLANLPPEKTLAVIMYGILRTTS